MIIYIYILKQYQHPHQQQERLSNSKYPCTLSLCTLKTALLIGCCCIPGLWAVVNNAGVGGSVMGPLEWHRRDAYRELLDVNLLGMVDVTRIFLPLIRKGQGRIVNMSSMAGRIATTGNGLYTVSKYAVEGYSDCLRYW